MKSRIQIAARRWAELRASLSEDNLDELDDIERTILKGRPSSTQDAIAIIDVVAAGITAGERSDGLDAKALRSVSQMLRANGQGSDLRPLQPRP